LASFLLSGKQKPEGSSFRDESRRSISELTPAGVFSGNVRSTILIRHVSEPRTIALGKYEIDMIASRNVIEQSGQIEEIPFNRTFTLEAVDIPRSPLGKTATEVERVVYSIREAGLEITDIKPAASPNIEFSNVTRSSYSCFRTEFNDSNGSSWYGNRTWRINRRVRDCYYSGIN
jgi:hypothetical protein